MKIDTKKATTVSPHCKASDNPFIPKGFAKDDGEESGRELAYVPTAIFTPVLTSKRTKSSRLSESDLQELSVQISKMIISDDAPKEQAKKADKKVVLKAEDKPLSEPRGRFEVEVVASSKLIVRVTRSLRLISVANSLNTETTPQVL